MIYTTILLNYIEYETDNGIFFSNSEKYNGIDFYNQGDKMPRNYANIIKKGSEKYNACVITFDDCNDSDDEEIGILFLRINGRSLERYKRAYPKLQSLIADIISTIQFVLLIYEYLTNNLYSNKIGVEIIKNILSKDYDKKIKIILKDKKEEDNKIKGIKFVDNYKKNNKENRKFEEKKQNKDNKLYKIDNF